MHLTCHLLISAIGSKVKIPSFAGLNKDEFNQIRVNEHYETSLRNVFAAGDGVTGPKTVIHALAGGKIAAEKILERLQHDV
jgi:glutamate synthase (NADPH/NADH) small chain